MTYAEYDIYDAAFLVPDGHHMAQVLTVSLWEPQVVDYLLERLGPDDTFVDVGASFGYYTVLFAGRVKKVIAFEPLVECYEVLCENIALNEFKNVEAHNSALFSSKRGYSVSRGGPLTLDEGARLTSRLDDILKGRRVDAIKIDTEGAEYDILLGARETIEKYKPMLALEIHEKWMLSTFGRSTEELTDLLDSMGYECETVMAESLFDISEHLVCEPTIRAR